MGIFSDSCQALVDLGTGKCLSGETLLQARQDKKAPRCKARVKKAAKFCSKCGSKSPGGWSKCPSCSKWVGNESEFCWKCNHALHPGDKGAVSDGNWQKAPGVLAQRLDVGDVLELLRKKKEIMIGEGSSAILLQGGKFKDVLGAGQHSLTSLAHKINHWGDPPPRAIVLVDSGDVIVSVRADDLRSSEDIPVELYAEVIIRLVPSDKAGKAFMANVMKDARELTYDAFTSILKAELRQAILDVCTTGTVEDLFKDPERHLQVENAMEKKLKGSEERYGFELVRVSSAEFTGKAYEELRAANGELEIQRRQLEFDAKMRELVTQDKMHQFKDQADLDAYVSQIAHEKEVSGEHRDHELALLRLVQSQEIDSKVAAHAMAQEMDKTAHDLNIKMQIDGYERDKDLLDEKARAESTMVWLKVKEEKERVRLKAMKDEMAAMAGQDMKTLMAVLSEDKREALLKYNKQEATKDMTPEQLIAAAAQDNPELARAVLEDMRAKGMDREKDWEERKKLMAENADRLERITNKALDATSEAAKGKQGDNTIIK